jgi:hypothetical protein
MLYGVLLSERWESGGERPDIIFGERSRRFCNQQGGGAGASNAT